MASVEKTRFRLTVWPQFPLPIPRVARREVMSFDDDLLVFGSYLPPVELPDEFYLRELQDLDPGDDQEVLDFTTQWGLLCAPASWGADLPLVPRPLALAMSTRDDFVTIDEQLKPEWVVHVEEIRHRVRVLRAMVGHWELANDVSTGTSAWKKQGLGVHRGPGGSWRTFRDHLNAGLGVVQPFADVVTDAAPREANEGLVLNSTYDAAMRQLFNHVLEGAAYRRCGLVGCGNLFYRQRGRSEHGQYRTSGVTYCTAECGDNQAARNYRARKSRS